MSRKLFLNPVVIYEILAWHKRSGENLLVFEALARACRTCPQLLLASDNESALEITNVLENWCSSADFQNMLIEAGKVGAGISLDLARQSLSHFSGSESFVHGLPIDRLLLAFSSLLRAELRSRESRAAVRIDELFLYRCAYRSFEFHDLLLLIMAGIVPDQLAVVFEGLLAIKEDAGTLRQLKPELFPLQTKTEFISGMRSLALHNLDAAKSAFEICRTKSPEDPSVRLAFSLLHLLTGDTQAALAQLSTESEDPNEAEGAKELSQSCSLWMSTKQAVRLLAASLEHGPYSEHDAAFRFEDTVSQAVQIYLHLKRRDYKIARDLCLKLNELDSGPIARLLLAESIVSPLLSKLANDPPLPASLSRTDRDDLEEAREILLSLFLDSYNQDLHAIAAIANTNLSVVFMLLRDFQTALKSARAARRFNQRLPEAQLNESIAALALGELPGVFAALEPQPRGFELQARQILAQAYYHASLFEEAAAIWQEVLEEEKDRLWRLRILCRLLECYRFLYDAQKAQASVDELLRNYQQEPETLLALSYELWQQGKVEDAIAALKRAKEHALPCLKNWISWELGRFLFDAGQNLSATDEYVSIVDDSTDSIQAREFAVALFKAGLLPAAYERARALRLASGDVIAGITEIEADYLVRSQKLEEAKQLLLRLCHLRPLSILNRLALVRIMVALGEIAEAKVELDELRSLELSPQMQAEITAYIKDFESVFA